MAVTLSEDLALLALDHETGLPYDRAGTALPHALAATLILDLQAAGAVGLGDDEDVIATGTAPDDPLLAAAWTSIDGDRKARPLRDWVTRPTRLVKGLPRAVYEHLTDRGVLAHDGHTTVFHRDRYRELDERPGGDLVASLAAVLDGDREPDADELLLLALLRPCRLTSAVFPERDRRDTESRIKALLADDDRANDVATRVARAAAAEVAVVAAAGAAAASAG